MLDSPTFGAGGTLLLVAGAGSLLCHRLSAGGRRDRAGRAAVRSVMAATLFTEAIVVSFCLVVVVRANGPEVVTGARPEELGLAFERNFRSIELHLLPAHQDTNNIATDTADMVSSIVPPKVCQTHLGISGRSANCRTGGLTQRKSSRASLSGPPTTATRKRDP